MLAVLAPTVGPLVGGWITTNWSWHWLFLINIGPGVLAVLIAVFSLPRDKVQLTEVAKLDIVAIIVLATTLTTLELGLKQAPGSGWLSWQAGGFLAAFFILGWIFVARMRASDRPIVDLTPLGDRNFALACVLSFILGLGLYGNVYLMPVFLAYVSGHDAFEIGQVMLVTGAAQLVAAPIVVALEGWINARILSVFGFCLFAFGLYLSAGDNPRADFDQMLLPQMVRGCAIMFCLLPPTRIALGALQPESVPNASAMFNLMRNLGGAIGIALIDTVLFGRAPGHGADLAERLLNRQPSAYTFVGLPQPLDSVVITDQMKQLARPAVERAALTLAVDEAWTMLAALTTLGVLAALAVRTDATRGSSSQSKSH
jgi:DHA2 family multidrug resistance protein